MFLPFRHLGRRAVVSWLGTLLRDVQADMQAQRFLARFIKKLFSPSTSEVSFMFEDSPSVFESFVAA